jgi:hypothetical protein
MEVEEGTFRILGRATRPRGADTMKDRGSWIVDSRIRIIMRFHFDVQCATRRFIMLPS